MLQWEEDMPFEEADSNDDGDEGHGVGTETAFTNDELDSARGFFMTQQHVRPNLYDHHSYYSEKDYKLKKNGSGGIRQSAYRDKEEHLVQTALDRIRRAQALGKSNVRLTKPELDALERKQRKNQATGRNPGFPERPAQRLSDTTQHGLAAVEPQSSKRRVVPTNFEQDYTGPTVYGRTASQTTPPLNTPENQINLISGYYSGTGTESYNLSMPRRTGSHDQQHQNASPSASQLRDPQKRYFSVPEIFRSSPATDTPAFSRRLPDDPRWNPRPRSASSAQPYISRDIQHSENTPSLRHITPTRPQGRRRVLGWSEPYLITPGRGIRPSLAVTTTQPQPSFLESRRSDGSISMATDVKDTVDDRYDDDRAELDYNPYEEPNTSPDFFYEQYPRR